MIYIFREKASNSARDLAEELCLKGIRARKVKRLDLRVILPEDLVICWGSHVDLPDGVRSINNVPLRSKFSDAVLLREEGIRTIQVSLMRPPQAPEVFHLDRGDRFLHPLNRIEASLLLGRLQSFVDSSPEEWLPRRNNHVGGNDLLEAPWSPDFYSKKESITEEYRLHMFKGKSIRAGKKIHSPSIPFHHEWIRSFSAGWILAYENFKSTREMRELASKAVSALGLDFGAVDLGRLASGDLIVLEVNRAPGIEGGTTEAYAKAIGGLL